MRGIAAVLVMGMVAAWSLFAGLVGKAGTPVWDLRDVPKVGTSAYLLGRAAAGSLEISGVVLSRVTTDVFWGIQDAGSSFVFSIDSEGRFLRSVGVDGLVTEDLEGIATDNAGNLYLADTGTNLRGRTEVFVHRIREPRENEESVPVDRSWRVHWPEAGRDCESVFVHEGSVWLVAKIRSNKQKSTLARFAMTDTNDPVELDVVGDLAVSDPVAGADLMPDGSVLAVSTGKGVYSWRIGGNVASAVELQPAFFPSTPDTKKEGIAFVPQGILIVTETRDRYLETSPMLLGRDLNPKLHWERKEDRVQLGFEAALGIACTLERRERLDRGDWIAVATNFPGLGMRGKIPSWNGTDRELEGFFRLSQAPGVSGGKVGREIR